VVRGLVVWEDGDTDVEWVAWSFAGYLWEEEVVNCRAVGGCLLRRARVEGLHEGTEDRLNLAAGGGSAE